MALALWAPLTHGKDNPKPAASSASSTPALAQSLTGQAKDDYEAAKILYGDADYAGAVVKFSAAYERSRDARLLWNMGACEKNLRHYAKVLAYVRRYLAEGGALITEQDRTEARDLLATIESFTAALTLKVNEVDAKVFVDDELVGTTPLAGPVVVDLGTRRIRVEKPGYLTWQGSLGVGGSKALTQDVQLAREVHEGMLTLRSSPGARILIDGQEVGKGSWSGTLPSRGHTLRIEQEGMLPHQSEIAIQDGDNRVIDVPLEKLPPRVQTVVLKPAEAGPAPSRFELGVRGGYGILFPGGDAKELGNVGFVPFWLEIGNRRGKVSSFGLYLQHAGYDRGKTCGVSRHGPEPESAGDLQVRYAYTSCQHYGMGFEALFHTLPSLKVDPWFGFDVGVQYSVRKYKSFDPLTARYDEGKDGGPAGAFGAQIGVDFKLIGGLGFGPFARLAWIAGQDLKPSEPEAQSTNQIGNSTCPAGSSCSSEAGEYASSVLQTTFGLRAAYTF